MLLASSSQPFVADLFFDPEASSAVDAKAGKGLKGFKFNSVGSQFKKQLADLMAQLNAMEPHYIRCIKPNSLNQAGNFENKNALHQLRCGGERRPRHLAGWWMALKRGQWGRREVSHSKGLG